MAPRERLRRRDPAAAALREAYCLADAWAAVTEWERTRRRFDRARLAALLGLHYDADAFDHLVLDYRRARRRAAALGVRAASR